MKNGRRTILMILAVLVLGIVLGVVVFLIHDTWLRRSEPAPAGPVQTMQTPAPTPTPTPPPTPAPTPTPTPTPEPYDPPEDLLMYQAKNPHVIGLLDIPGTNIRYPILQHPSEDNYYLNVTIDGNYGYPGSIYTNLEEGQEFETFNTVIYGHNMSDGSMFGTLNQFDNVEFMKSHREIVIYTYTQKIVYTVCAEVIYDDRYITYTYNDGIEADRAAYLRSLQSGKWLDDVEVTTSSRLITLSTCIGGMPENRRLLIAVAREEPADAGVQIVLPQGNTTADYTSRSD